MNKTREIIRCLCRISCGHLATIQLKWSKSWIWFFEWMLLFVWYTFWWLKAKSSNDQRHKEDRLLNSFFFLSSLFWVNDLVVKPSKWLNSNTIDTQKFNGGNWVYWKSGYSSCPILYVGWKLSNNAFVFYWNQKIRSNCMWNKNNNTLTTEFNWA